MRLLPLNRNLMMQDRGWDSLLDDFFGSTSGGPVAARQEWHPSADIVEQADHYEVTVDLPGVDKSNVRITVENDQLTISGERNEERKTEEGQMRRFERFSGSFRRSFSLPEGIDPESVGAKYKDGVLTVTVPKPEEAKPKLIEVKVK
ncbi:MAG: Hsp20/alpha crystallin family protein [Gemmatimonadetes bacterium]|nr:Hsp20/alpha crystallin family protein [Gemmatimonadota bacterium]